MRTWAARIGRKWFFVIGVYFILFSVVTFVLDLPRAYYEGFVREHAYGLSNQTFAKWAGDSVIALLVSMVMGVLFLWVPYLLLRKSPQRWWLYTGLLAVPFLCFILLVTPVWIDPLFNTFGSMKNTALESKILALADRAGIAGSRVYEVNKSVDTKALNAYVSGLGNTKRVVLWDTIIARLDEPELLFVMGHEMGHYVLGHTWKLIALLSATDHGCAVRHPPHGGLGDRPLSRSPRLRLACRCRLAAAAVVAVQRLFLHRHACGPGLHASLRARGRSVRARDHPDQPLRRRWRS